MALRKPIVNDPATGRNQALQSGDTLITPDGLQFLATDSLFLDFEGGECAVNTGNTQYLDIASGKAVIPGATTRFVVTFGAFTKRLNTAWAAGTNAGGLLTGSSFPASTTLHIYVMRSRATGAVDHGAHTSATQSTFVDGSSITWDLRLHMSITTGASAIVDFKQDGNRVTYKQPISDVVASIPATATLYALSVPTGIKVYPNTKTQFGGLTSGNGYVFYLLSDPDTTDIAPVNGYNTGNVGSFPTTPASFYSSVAPETNLQTNTSGQIRARSSNASTGSTYITTYGYFHPRGGNPSASQTTVLNNGFTYLGYFGGNTPLVSPSIGDTWREENSSGIPIMDWFWDGSTWKSLELFQTAINQPSAGISATAGYHAAITNSNNYDVYANNFTLCSSSSLLTSATYWSFQPRYAVKNAATFTSLGSLFDDKSNANSNYIVQVSALNTLITFANFAMFSLLISKVSTPGTLSFSASFDYRWSRP